MVVAALLGVLTSGCGYVTCRLWQVPDETCRSQSWQGLLLPYDPWTAGEERGRDD